MITHIKHDTPIEVSKKKYDYIMTRLAGTCAGQERDGKCFIKLWHPSGKRELLKTLNAED